TVGGIGLTGLIISVRFRLIRVESAFYDVRYEKARNIDKALELFSESDDKYQYSVAWIDCLAKGSSLGRCVLMRGNHATQEQVRGSNLYRIHSKPKLNVPINLPSFILNNMSIKLFNQAYYQFNPSGKDLIVHYNPFFYPLDSINNWNRMYGRKGFVQYQAVFPPETSRQGLIKMLERLSNTKRSSFLAVLKSSGAENNGLLSFPRKGYTLALDIPIKDQTLFPFINNLDELVANHGGRVYLAKDSTLSINDFEVMYPKIKKFKEIKNKVDPNQLFASSMSRRLGITEA
ncbi:MAG: FAD-linked oxidase, partial [Neobacillus sp.]|nr:FAD-linked oxidase [Neobacillus sp.]